jgi:excisionase family DNA binding protein
MERDGRSAAARPGPDEAPLQWLSTKEAAHHLGITPRTLYRLIDSGQLPAYRFGRVIRLKEAEVNAFIDSARIEPGSLEHLYADAGQGESD